MFLDARDRGAGAASGKLPMAGVDGLLARPLFVVTTVVVVGVWFGGASCFDSISSGFGGLSFLVRPFTALGGRALASSLLGSVLIIVVVDSFIILGSAEARGPVGATGSSGGTTFMPLGRFDADEAGRCRLFSAVD